MAVMPCRMRTAIRLEVDQFGCGRRVLVVAKCLPGGASAVTVEIDDAAIPEIVGTLAGDTIFRGARSKSRNSNDQSLGDVCVH